MIEMNFRRLLQMKLSEMTDAERAAFIAFSTDAEMGIEHPEVDALADGTLRISFQGRRYLAERSATGDPQVWPYRECDSNALGARAQLDPTDNSDTANLLREVAQSICDHRAAYRNGHTLNCRGDLYRGLCH